VLLVNGKYPLRVVILPALYGCVNRLERFVHFDSYSSHARITGDTNRESLTCAKLCISEPHATVLYTMQRHNGFQTTDVSKESWEGILQNLSQDITYHGSRETTLCEYVDVKMHNTYVKTEGVH
jgi:hypothetical protein